MPELIGSDVLEEEVEGDALSPGRCWSPWSIGRNRR